MATITARAGNRKRSIKVRRPPWDKVYEGYPKREDPTSITNENDEYAELVFISIMGENYDRNIFINACATRLSLALLNGGMKPPRNYPIIKGKFAGKGVIVSAAKMIEWLKKQFGSPEVFIRYPESLQEIQNAIGNRKGIYGMIAKDPKWASGHVTLWHKNNAIGGHNYFLEAKKYISGS
ncbi:MULTISPECIES: T6SS effector amidase Tae4 family protein [unclassified Avibacterium]|uniref:T6SS effector amidase Tae4 family protein n=1 Tax=unclassified Avibacterium TaxID=2685287 RepID=UPI0020264384|nr:MULTISPECIES: T6SS effector amidase Tae4 family protein [unclassified Avibacterium]MCW9718671.1 type VI secretion system amidase effector protein Tae4 [Avibacterium sp. 21-599]MCW9734052.1 type VI secretion system amidase effector protein Tae4 [Avibacterium sp. 20-15]URL03699.1 type VI secretion system amidase effector protein Tae4 [Avibacterium sp. 20-132]